MGFLDQAEALREVVPTKEEKLKEEDARICNELVSIVKQDIILTAKRTPVDGNPLSFMGTVYLGVLGESPLILPLVSTTATTEKHFFRSNKRVDTYTITPRGQRILASVASELKKERICVIGLKCGFGLYKEIYDTNVADYSFVYTTIGSSCERVCVVEPRLFCNFPFSHSSTTDYYDYDTFTNLSTGEIQTIKESILGWQSGLYMDYSVGQ